MPLSPIGTAYLSASQVGALFALMPALLEPRQSTSAHALAASAF